MAEAKQDFGASSTILVHGIKDELNERNILLSHFSKFGQVLRISCSKKNKYALLHFSSKEEAKKAKDSVKDGDPALPNVKIFFSKRSLSNSLSAKPKNSSGTPMKPNIKKSKSTVGNLSATVLLRKSQPKKEGPGNVNVSSLECENSPEIQELFSRKYNNAEERYRALESRDKILRSRMPKMKVSVEQAVLMKGTCPDMCPEKERYQRQFQRQLGVYETMDGENVDHCKAIKVYSRSSADQEEPLPHELRPVSTLELTMSHLLHNIIPMCESDENLSDWYNFVWDRTRSIRKDITQQQICSLNSVSLLEKCARFHIFCASRLCELDMHSFDPKLNDENLMKCLQSLEHLYDDLRAKGIHCPNEPEFRAYKIMMNLNEGDDLWDIQQKPLYILKSPEVAIAIKAHHSIFNRNFVSFFKTLKIASYFASCVLHRYIFQVRTIGLRTILKSQHVSAKTEACVNLSKIQAYLGFYPTEKKSFIHFCQVHGLRCEEEADKLFFSRKSYNPPDTPIINREKDLVESKLSVSISEAINKEPLGTNPLLTYRPHSSFDKGGALIPGVVIGFTEDQIDNLPVRPSPSNKVNQIIKPEPDQAKTGLATQNAILWQEIPLRPSTSQFVHNCFEDINFPEEIVESLAENLLTVVVNRMVGKVMQSAISSFMQEVERKLQLEMKRKAEEERKRRIIVQRALETCSEHVGLKILDSYLEAFCLETLATCKDVVKSVGIMSGKVWIGISTQVISTLVQEISKNCLDEFKECTKKKAEKFEAILKRAKTRHVFYKWRKYAKLKSIRKRTIALDIMKDRRTFPPAVHVVTPGKKMKQIVEGQNQINISPLKPQQDEKLIKFSVAQATLDILEQFETVAQDTKFEVLSSFLSPLKQYVRVLTEQKGEILGSKIFKKQPLLINVALFSSTAENSLLEWLWQNLKKQCVSTSDENVLFHPIMFLHKGWPTCFIVFSKNPPLKSLTTETRYVLLFCDSYCTHLQPIVNFVMLHEAALCLFFEEHLSYDKLEEQLMINNYLEKTSRSRFVCCKLQDAGIVGNVPIFLHGVNSIMQFKEVVTPSASVIVCFALAHLVRTIWDNIFEGATECGPCPWTLWNECCNLWSKIVASVQEAHELTKFYQEANLKLISEVSPHFKQYVPTATSVLEKCLSRMKGYTALIKSKIFSLVHSPGEDVNGPQIRLDFVNELYEKSGWTCYTPQISNLLSNPTAKTDKIDWIHLIQVTMAHFVEYSIIEDNMNSIVVTALEKDIATLLRPSFTITTNECSLCPRNLKRKLAAEDQLDGNKCAKSMKSPPERSVSAPSSISSVKQDASSSASSMPIESNLDSVDQLHRLQSDIENFMKTLKEELEGSKL